MRLRLFSKDTSAPPRTPLRRRTSLLHCGQHTAPVTARNSFCQSRTVAQAAHLGTGPLSLSFISAITALSTGEHETCTLSPLTYPPGKTMVFVRLTCNITLSLSLDLQKTGGRCEAVLSWSSKQAFSSLLLCITCRTGQGRTEVPDAHSEVQGGRGIVMDTAEAAHNLEEARAACLSVRAAGRRLRDCVRHWKAFSP